MLSITVIDTTPTMPDEGLTLKTSANTLFTAFSIYIHINLTLIHCRVRIGVSVSIGVRVRVRVRVRFWFGPSQYPT